MLDIITNLNHNTPPIVDEKSFIAVHKPWYILYPIKVNLKNCMHTNLKALFM